MGNSKNPKSFRLSDQAERNLEKLCIESGASQTAVVEMALAFLAKSMSNALEIQRPTDKQPPFRNVYK